MKKESAGFPPERVLRVLEETYPRADCALAHKDPFQLLVATILSAQCTDAKVNEVTPALFARFPDPPSLAAASLEEIREIIRPTGFYVQKARYLKESAGILVERHGGKVPERLEALTELPGVARKTANVVLGTWFGRNEGVVVDTHVKRLAGRLGLSKEKDPGRIEKDLMELFPRESWTFLGHALILLGREFCRAKKPRCPECPLREDCPKIGVAFEGRGDQKDLPDPPRKRRKP